jgi:uncharacterized protein
MAEPDYRARLQEYIRIHARPPEKFSHQARLYALAWQLGQAEGKPFDDDVLFAAAWLHDLGVFIGHRPEDPQALERWDHISYAIAKAQGILRELRFPEPRIPTVCEAIRTHLPASTPGSFEGILLRDADMLEQLGAVGILRTVSKVGRDTRFKLFSDALRVLRENLEQLPARLTLGSARQLAEHRIQVLRSFLAAAEAESAGIDW